jgi:hypothetical protein
MKTMKIAISIALVALTATSLGQLSLKERIFSNHNDRSGHYIAHNRSDVSMMESWMYDLSSWAGEKPSRHVNKTPVAPNLFHIEQHDFVREEALILESWMTAPFETSVSEEALILESWMTAPFESTVNEGEIIFESWMATPWI